MQNNLKPSLSVPCRAALLAVLLLNVAFGELLFDPDNTSLTIRAPAVSASMMKPRVQLLPGDGDSLLDWTPDTAPALSREIEDPPLGKAENTLLT